MNLKKPLLMFLCAAASLALAACSILGNLPRSGETPAPEKTDAGTGLPNPVESVENASAFAALDIAMDAPEGATDISYFIIGGALAEVRFTLGGFAYTYRASRDEGDISGVYDAFEPAFSMQVESGAGAVAASAENAASGGRRVLWAHEGVWYSLWCAGEPDDETLKSTVLYCMAQSFGAEGIVVADLVDFTQARSLNMDLNGDGLIERVAFDPAYDDQNYIVYTTMRVSSEDGSAASADLELICDPSAAFAYDIDADGLVELFISGDICSCDYETWIFRYDAGELIPAEPAYTPDYLYDYILPAAFGAVEKIEGSVVTIGDTIDILGSWWCTTQYRMNPDGVFALERVPGSIWTSRNADVDSEELWEGGVLVASAEIPAMLDGDSAPSALPAGTKLALLDTDGASYFHFFTRDGLTGVIYVAFAEEGWGWRINGIDEFELFSELPYAG